MKLKISILGVAALLVTMIVAVRCSKDTTSTHPTTGDTIHHVKSRAVYIAGTVGGNASYWRNDTLVSLSSGVANSIFVSGDSVLVGGYSAVTYQTMAAYWLNGALVTLTSAPDSAMINSICIANKKIYAAGYLVSRKSGSPIYFSPVYWVNNTMTILADNTHAGAAYSIAVKGTDVYVAGTLDNVPVYWKNGELISLSEGSDFTGTAFAITWSGSDIFVAGFEYSGPSGQIAKYWKNGTAINLTDGAAYDRAFDVVVSGTDVYVALSKGYVKNGTTVPLTTDKYSFGLTGMAISNSDIFVSGTAYGDQIYAEYWKNGAEVVLAQGTYPTAANDVFIAN